MEPCKTGWLMLTVVVGLAASHAEAGMIQGVSPSDVVSVLDNGVTNNDNVSITFDNFLETDVPFPTFDPVDLVLHIADTGGTTEYDHWYYTDNNTGQDWKGFILEIGFTDADGVFHLADVPGLDFDTSPDPAQSRDSIVAFFHHPPDLPVEDARLVWSDVPGLYQNAPLAEFSLDLPDASAGVPLWAQTSDGYDLTLRGTPIPMPVPVPEPGALAIALGGMTLLTLRRRRNASA